MNELGSMIRAARKSAGMSVKDLAAAIGVSVGYVQQIECGECGPPRRIRLVEIADVLDLDRDDLFDVANASFHKKNHDVALFDKIQRIRFDEDTHQW